MIKLIQLFEIMKKCILPLMSSYSTSKIEKANLEHKNIRLKNINSSMKNLNRLLLMPLMVLVVLFGSGNVWGQQSVSWRAESANGNFENGSKSLDIPRRNPTRTPLATQQAVSASAFRQFSVIRAHF